MAPRTIQQRIVLQGGEDIQRQFAELARAGEQAFRDIGQAAQNLRTVDVPTEKLRQQLIQLGQTGQQAFRQISQAGQTAASQVSQSSQQATTQVRAIGTAAQQTANQMGTIGGAATQSLAQVQTQASSTSSALTAVRTVALTITGAFAAAAAAATGLAAAWTAMGKSASEAVLSIGRAADSAGVSINQFSRASPLLQQLGLTSDQAAAAVKRLAEATGGALGKALESLEASGSRFNREMLKTERGRAALANMTQELAKITVNGRSMFDETTAAVLKFGLAFNPVTGQARTGTVALVEFVDSLQNMLDPAKRAQAVTAVFGADLAKVLIPALQKGTAEFVNTLGQIDRLRLGVTDADKAIGQDFMRSWHLLQEVLKANNRELGLMVAKPITPFVERFAEAMRRSGTTLEFYQRALKAIQPILDDLLKLVEGRRGEIKLAWIEEAAKQLEGLATAARDVFLSVIVPALKTVATAAKGLARTLNDALGTNLNGLVVAAGALLLGLLAPVKAVGVALAAIFLGEGEGFDKFREKLKEFGVDIDAIKEKIIAVVDDIRLLFQGLDTEVKNKDLVELKKVLIEFGTSLPGIIAEVAVLFVALVRIVGPGRAAALMFANFTGVLQTAVLVLAGLSAASFVLLNAVTLLIRVLAALGVGFAPFLASLVLVSGAIAIVVANIDKFIAAFEGVKALLSGNLGRADRAFELIGVGAKQAQAGVQALREELEQSPNMSAWEQPVAFVFGFLREEHAAFHRDLETLGRDIVKFAQQLIQPFREVGILIRATWEGILATLQIAWNQFIEEIRARAGILGNLLPKTEPAEQIIERSKERLRQLRSEYDAIAASGKSAAAVVQQSFEAMETALARSETAARGAKIAIDDIKTSGNLFTGVTQESANAVATVGNQWKATTERISGGFRQIAPGMWQSVTQEGTAAAAKTEQAFKGTAQNIQNGFRQVGPGMWEQIVQGGQQAAQKTEQVFSSVARTAEETLKGAVLQEGLDRIAENAGRIDQAFDAIDTDKAQGELEQLRSALDGIVDQAKRTNELLTTAKPQRLFDDGLPEGQVEDRRGEGNIVLQQLQAQLQAIDSITAEIEQLFNSLIDGIVAKFQQAGTAIGAVFTGVAGQVGSTLVPAFDGISTAFLAPFQQAAQGIKAIIDEIILKVQAITQQQQPGVELGAGAGVGLGVGGMFGGVVASATAAVSQITVLFQGLALSITQALSAISAGDVFVGVLAAARVAANGILAAFNNIGQGLAGALQGADQAVAQVMASIQNVVQAGFASLQQLIGSAAAQVDAAIAQIVAALEQAVARVQALSAAATFAGSGGGGGEGFASGGYTGSIGTRQIAGVVHGGEYVQPARVVRQPGVLQFMETLRRVGDLRKAIQLFARGFNVGGLVDNFNARLSSLVLPQFATGGLVPAAASNGRTPDFGTVTVDFGQGRRAQIITDEDSVRALRRISIQNQILSGGREV
jgi:hypothetical protein